MKRLNTFSYLCMCYLFLIGCSKLDQEKPVWRTFTPPDGDFSISAPGQLTDTYDQIQTALGAIPRHRYTVSIGSTYYGVERHNYPKGSLSLLDVTEALDLLRDDAIKAIPGGRLADESLARLGDKTGRDLRIEFGGGKTIVRSRMFVVGDRVYAIIVVAARRHESDTAIEQFIASFRLL
ncbi:MAG: hypothetical protein KA257_07700 [Opitutaceae bacterium]|nr:hypothetical protein [Opitutaceae bacterium]MBP9912896.1 hypothetical protein [Opitutaceae bacterium]